MLGKPCWGRKIISLFSHVARSCWGSHVGEAKKLAFFPMLRDHVGEAMLGKQKNSLFPMLRDHVGEAILGVPWCAIIG